MKRSKRVRLIALGSLPLVLSACGERPTACRLAARCTRQHWRNRPGHSPSAVTMALYRVPRRVVALAPEVRR